MGRPQSSILILALLAAASGPAPGGSAAEAMDGAGAAAGGIRRMGRPAPAIPRRVVSLAPSLTDAVIALGHADRLVGVTRYDRAPEVAKLPRVGGFLDPSAEAVVALRPDLVLWLTDGGALPAVRRIAGLGVPVLALPIVSVADVLAATRAIGEALGDAASGERVARQLDDAISRARARAASLPRRRVLFVVGREPLVVAGPGSYPDELLRIAGAENVVTGTVPWPVLPVERAAAANPDLVIDAAVNEPGEGALLGIPAVRRGDVRRLETDDALRPGPRLARALETLLAAIHPEARQR